MNMVYAIKADIDQPAASLFEFPAHRTMYGGKHIAEGDTVFLFANEHGGGQGLIARGVVVSAEPTPRVPGLARQTPRVSVTVRSTAIARRRLGRDELRSFCTWDVGRPETELNFKLYRQATNKIISITDGASAFLHACFDEPVGSLPLRCLPSAIPADERRAHFERTRDLFMEVREREELPEGLGFRFDAQHLTAIALFVEYERRCCPFLRFVIDQRPEGGAVWLRLTGPKGTREFLQAALPVAS